MGGFFRYAYLSACTIVFISGSCVLEEFMFKQLPGFNYYAFVGLVELFLFAAFALPPYVLDREQRRAPVRVYVGAGCAMALGTVLGKAAYKHLNYTSGTVLKSLKLVPVIIVGKVALKRTFASAEMLAAALMTLSALLISAGDAEEDPNFHVLGVVLSLACLAAQAAQNNLQDHALRDHGASVGESMVYANGFGFVAALAVCVAEANLFEAVAFFGNPRHAALLIARSLAFYIGARFYTALIREAGATAAVVVTTARKLITILGSLLLFPDDKVFTGWHALGGTTFLLAVAVDVRHRLQRARK